MNDSLTLTNRLNGWIDKIHHLLHLSSSVFMQECLFPRRQTSSEYRAHMLTSNGLMPERGFAQKLKARGFLEPLKSFSVFSRTNSLPASHCLLEVPERGFSNEVKTATSQRDVR